MRTLGVEESYITGTKSDKEKFDQWAATVPYTLRNPLYHWTHLELQRYFDINTFLNSQQQTIFMRKAVVFYRKGLVLLLGLLKNRKVEVVCTTDDPTDDLAHHQKFANTGESIKMFLVSFSALINLY